MSERPPAAHGPAPAPAVALEAPAPPVAPEAGPEPARRSRARRLLLAVGATLAAVALILGLAGWWLLATPSGTRWLFARAGAMIPGSLSVGELAGPIRGPLTVRGLVYRSDSLELRVEQLELEWRLRALLGRQLDIVSLEAEGVTVSLADSGQSEDPQRLPDVHLPINIIVRTAQIRDIEVLRAGDAEPLVIDSIELVTRTRGEVVEIERLSVDSPEISALARGTVEPQGDYPVDLDLEWSAQLPDRPRWAGSGHFAGSLEQLEVEHALSSPVLARLDVVLTTPLRDLSFDGWIEAPPFVLAELSADLPSDITLGGRINARGTLEDLETASDLTAQTTLSGPARVAASVSREGDRWRLTQMMVSLLGSPTRLEATGELQMVQGGPPQIDLRAWWSDLSWPLTGEASLHSPEGTAQVTGTLADYQLDANVIVAPAAGQPLVPVQLASTGNQDGLTIELATARLLEGALTARGELAWAPRVEWDLALEGQQLDPSTLWPEASGELAVVAKSVGHVADNGAVGSVAPLRLTGLARGEQLEAAGSVAFAGDRLDLADFRVDWGSLHLVADGQVSPTLDFTYAVDAPNLALVLPGSAGALTSSGRVTGPPRTPHLVASARAEGFAREELSLATLTIEADLDLAPDGKLELEAIAGSVVLGARSFERLAVDLDGTRERHRLSVDATGARTGAVQLQAIGGLSLDTEWRGTLDALDLESPAAGSWSLASPAAIVASASTVELERLCASSGPARVCLQGAWLPKQGWSAAAELTEVPLALASSWLPPNTTIAGTVTGTAQASATAEGTINLTADLRPGPGEVVYPVAEGASETLRFGLGSLTAAAGATGLELAFDFPLPELGEASGTLRLPGYRLGTAPAPAQPLAATLIAEITDLGFLQAFSEQLDDTGGRLDVDLTVGGTLGQPSIGGRALLSQGQATIPQLGIQLTEMRLLATGQQGDGSDALEIEGSLRSGDGTLTLSGVAPAVPTAQHPIRIEIGGTRFLAIDTAQIQILANPDLELTYDGELLAITGEVLVPEAAIEVARGPGGRVTVSPDVVYVGQDQVIAEPASSLAAALRLRVVLGDKVEIDAFGLAGTPTGSLLLIEEPGRPTRATGEIDLAGGTYQAYGQDLTIERGRLTFSGPVTNPRVDLRAFRRADDGVVAGLEATGTLARPEITLWSEPPMDQTNQLSYLVLGRPVGQASAEDVDLVANAASSLAIKGGNLLAERLASRFGLEEARIETEGGYEEASLVLGRYLSPRLYVAYGLGLFEAANTLRLRYILSTRWTLEATIGEGSAADLLYTIERGEGARRRAPGGAPALREQSTGTSSQPQPRR